MVAQRWLRVLIVLSLLGGALALALLTGWSVLWPMWQDREVGRAMERAILTGSPGNINDAIGEAKKTHDGIGAIPVLARWLKDGDDKVRLACALGIGDLGPTAKDAVAALIEAMADENSEVCRRSTVALGKIGQPAVPQLIRALTHKNPQIRGWCAEALGEIGPDARSAIDALAALVRDDSDRVVRRDAARALPFIDFKDDRSRAAVLHALERGPDEDRYRLGLALAGGREGNVEFLQACFVHDDVNVRAHAVQSFGYLSRKEVATFHQELLQALDDPAAQVRSMALIQLGFVGKRKSSVLPAVESRLTDPDSSVRTAAARAVWQIEQRADRAVPVLIEAVRDPGNVNRGLAAQVLSEIGGEAKQGADTLIAAIRQMPTHGQGDDRWHIAYALATLDPGHKEAATVLTELLRDENAASKVMIANALGELGPGARDAVPALAKCLGDPDAPLRRAVARALGQIGAPARSAIPALREALDDRDWMVRWEAEEALKKVLATED